MNPEGTGVVLGIELHPDTQVPAGSTAKITTENAIGIQALDIMPDGADPPYLADGDVVEVPEEGIPRSLDATLVETTDLVNSMDVTALSSLADTFGTAFGARDRTYRTCSTVPQTSPGHSKPAPTHCRPS